LLISTLTTITSDRLSAFSFDSKGAKEKAWQKENTERGISLVATSDQGSAFGNRKLLKKFDQNFLVTLRPSLDFSLHN